MLSSRWCSFLTRAFYQRVIEIGFYKLDFYSDCGSCYIQLCEVNLYKMAFTNLEKSARTP